MDRRSFFSHTFGGALVVATPSLAQSAPPVRQRPASTPPNTRAPFPGEFRATVQVQDVGTGLCETVALPDLVTRVHITPDVVSDCVSLTFDMRPIDVTAWVGRVLRRMTLEMWMKPTFGVDHYKEVSVWTGSTQIMPGTDTITFTDVTVRIV